MQNRTKSDTISRSWPDLPLPQTSALIQRMTSSHISGTSSTHGDSKPLLYYRARALRAPGIARFHLYDADARLLRALETEKLPFDLHTMSWHSFGSYWEADLQLALSERVAVRGNFHFSGTKEELMVDHVVMLDTGQATTEGLAGWFSFSRLPRDVELVSDSWQVRRYRRTRPIFHPSDSLAERMLRRAGGW